jgi:hypothetical protein
MRALQRFRNQAAYLKAGLLLGQKQEAFMTSTISG